jgi:hypothetical protein
VRNVFDQYTQPENRVTHALMTALNEDRDLLAGFLNEALKIKAHPPVKKLHVLEQQFPGELEPSDVETEHRGIPDGWIYSDDGWCVFIENKIAASLAPGQMMRHFRTAERLGFAHIQAVTITPVKLTASQHNVTSIEWRDVYRWLHRYKKRSRWAAFAAEFLEITERKLIETDRFTEGTLTSFAGFPFGEKSPYSYLEAKRILGIALNDLRASPRLQNRLGVNPTHTGRGAITGRRETRVWDFLSVSRDPEGSAFTSHPHLTFGIDAEHVEACVTVPNAVNRAMKRKLASLGDDGFRAMLAQIVENMLPLLSKCSGAAPFFRGVQRRYPSQRAQPFIDAAIDFDLRTAFQGAYKPKYQPLWLQSAYGSFVNKQGANYQIQVGVRFRYDRCPELQADDSLQLLADAWLSCAPLLDLNHP